MQCVILQRGHMKLLFSFLDFMITSIHRLEDDGNKTLEFEEPTPGSTFATKIIGIVTQVMLVIELSSI